MRAEEKTMQISINCTSLYQILFTSQKLQMIQVSINRLNKLRHIHTIEYYSAHPLKTQHRLHGDSQKHDVEQESRRKRVTAVRVH